jgi:hypothetical protein
VANGHRGTTLARNLVSARFVGVLNAHGFTGWRTFAVTIEEPEEIPDYFVLGVTGRCGPIDDALSDRIIIPPPVPQGRPSPGLRGLCFAPETWDGSDIFLAENYNGHFVTTAVKDAIEVAGLANVELQCLADVERGWHIGGSLVGE